MIKSREELIGHIDAGNRVKYIFFWGHRETAGQVSKACLSQWYDAPFTCSGDRYQTVEHFMMAEKARLFGDDGKLAEILASGNPGKAKAIGRMVADFDQSIWDQHKFDIVVRGNLEKFGQNAQLKKFLLNTGQRVLVEASPVDSIWGIGLAADNPLIEDPRNWEGDNLLGFALMEARDRLREEGSKVLVPYGREPKPQKQAPPAEAT